MPETPPAARDVLLLAGAAAAAYAVVSGLTEAGLVLSTGVLPVLLALPAAWVLFRRLGAGDRAGALAAMSGWALALVVVGTLAMAALPEAAAGTVWRGESYQEEMMAWVVTGGGNRRRSARLSPGPRDAPRALRPAGAAERRIFSGW